MDLSIITVTWNSKEYITQQIASVVSGCKNISYEQFVVDNASTDGTVQAVREAFPHVRVIANTKNVGFGAGNNQAAAQASGRYVLFLNADMRVEPGSLDTFVAWMDQRPEVGIASPRLVDQHGNINAEAAPRRFPHVYDQLMLLLKIPHIFPSVLHGYLLHGFDFEKEQEVDSVRGSFFMMRRAVYEKRGYAFDPRYFIWFEEVDACREAKVLGYRVLYTPIISAVDFIGQSFKKRTTYWKQKQFTKSMLQYFQKWEPWYKWMWLAAVRPIAIALAWAYEKIA